MVALNSKTFLKISVLVLVVGIYFGNNVSGQYIAFKTTIFDYTCSVQPNFTALKDADKIHAQQSFTTYKSCMNETKNYFKLSLKRNATENERWDCRSKCLAVAEGITDQKGNLNKDLIKQRSKLIYSFSNATKQYVETITNKLTSCVEVADSLLQELKSNATLSVEECRGYDLYSKCLTKNRIPNTSSFRATYCPELMQS